MFGVMSVDLLPGPSEVVTLADSSGKPEFIAADMLAQAEHGGDSVMGFITDSEKLLDAVQAEVKAQIKTLSRQKQLSGSLKKGCWLILVETLDDGVQIVNDFAPEHLSLITRREKRSSQKLQHQVRFLSETTHRLPWVIFARARVMNCQLVAQESRFPV